MLKERRSFLDEATANVDPGERGGSCRRPCEALTGGKTIIMIAHRLKTVRNADQILVLDHGEKFSTAHMTSSLGNKESMPTSF